ncbi:MAG: hypothetical protein HY820_17865 [Acidobacteria bacterium]|nr:hypothetical protein [Acidobacteriota bacterium]
MLGYSGFSNAGWIAFGYPGHPPLLSFYAISGPLTADTPEPGTFWLATIPLALAVRRMRR